MSYKSSLIPLFAVGLLASQPAQSALVITADGANLGFSISTIVDNIQSPNGIVLGSAVNSAGQIMVLGFGANRVDVYNNTNNQTFANRVTSASFTNGVTALVSVNGVVYGGGGALRKLNNDGTTAATYANIQITHGMWTNPVNNKILAQSSGGALIEIDVSGATPTVRTVANNASADGLTVSPDGKFVYNSNGQKIDIATGAITNFSIASGADGMGVITSSNSLNGSIVVNTTNGRLVLQDALTFAQTVLATGGGYGDFVGADATTGTLMFGSANAFLRLSCGAGCGIGVAPPPPPPPSGVPLPASMLLFGLGLVAMAGTVRNRKA